MKNFFEVRMTSRSARVRLAMVIAVSGLAMQHVFPQVSASWPAAIEDNSFLIEEAYNQEAGVVQHISSALYLGGPRKDFAYSFTQEWPLGGQTHQLSYTIPYLSLGGGASGIGDIVLNYRYQLLDAERDGVALAPRFSLLLATGDEGRGLGSGAFGVQCNLPFSQRVSATWVYHLNAGVTILPNAKGKSPSGGVTHTLVSYAAGGSIIWLAAEKINFMFEAMATRAAAMDASGSVERTTEVLLGPGIRAAIDVGSLQIVPGISAPVSISEGLAVGGIFAYLSFEHPF